MSGAPTNRRRAGRYQVALATLRDRHRYEFDLILTDLRSAVASTAPGVPLGVGVVDGAADLTARQRPTAADSTHETNPPVAAGGPSKTSEGVCSLTARPS